MVKRSLVSPVQHCRTEITQCVLVITQTQETVTGRVRSMTLRYGAEPSRHLRSRRFGTMETVRALKRCSDLRYHLSSPTSFTMRKRMGSGLSGTQSRTRPTPCSSLKHWRNLMRTLMTPLSHRVRQLFTLVKMSGCQIHSRELQSCSSESKKISKRFR